MTDPHIEGTAEEIGEVGTEIVRAAPPGGVTTPVNAQDLVLRLATIEEAMRTAMVRDVDYGIVPGTDKPALFKPGAEKLSVLFQLDVQIKTDKIWGPGDHLTVEAEATVYHVPTGARLGSGEGECSTREKKYGKRMADRACPKCGAAAIKRSKFPPRNRPDAEPGWYCFGKIGGCGAQFDADDKQITSQQAGEVDNPELPDLWNTVVKMARKRAKVDAVLSTTGASALFTQDVEDEAPPAPSPEPAPAPPAPAATEVPPAKSRITEAFKRAGGDAEAARVAMEAMDELGVPPADSMNARVKGLTAQQADVVVDVLTQFARVRKAAA